MARPKRIFKGIFKLNIVVVIVWIATFVFFKSLGLEFTQPKYEENFNAIGVFSISTLAFTFLLRNVTESSSWKNKLLKLFFGFLSFILCVYALALASFSTGMCNWSIDAVLYQNKNHKNIKIVERSFGCGATDSSPSYRKTFLIEYLSSFLLKAKEVDVLHLKREKWDQTSRP